MAEHAVEAHGHGDEEEEHIHLPGPSVWPFMLALFLTVAMFGLVTWDRLDAIVTIVVTAIGAVGMAVSIISWGIQISEA